MRRFFLFSPVSSLLSFPSLFTLSPHTFPALPSSLVLSSAKIGACRFHTAWTLATCANPSPSTRTRSHHQPPPARRAAARARSTQRRVLSRTQTHARTRSDVGPRVAHQVPADLSTHLQDPPRGPQPHRGRGGGVHRADGECALAPGRGALRALAEEVAWREWDAVAVHQFTGRGMLFFFSLLLFLLYIFDRFVSCVCCKYFYVYCTFCVRVLFVSSVLYKYCVSDGERERGEDGATWSIMRVFCVCDVVFV